MKYGLLVTSPISSIKNIGDYMQSLAALQFIPKEKEYEYVEKEAISEYESDEPSKVIMNAWYIWHPEKWPPKPNSIDPLLISMHITPLTAEKMLSNGGKEYLKKYGPVGCRDKLTENILKNNNIPSYFSGCLTLTLGYKYKRECVKEGVIFVDPFIAPLRYRDEKGPIYYPNNVILAFLYWIRNPRKILGLSKKSYFNARLPLQNVYSAAMFYHAYSKMFDDKVLFNADYVTHMVSVTNGMSQEDLLKISEGLLSKYSKAKYVVTSRIHCALPCIGIETPVIFVDSSQMNSDRNLFGSPGRFGGLIDFFHVIHYKRNGVFTSDKTLLKLGKLGLTSQFDNKDNWKKYRDKMIDICKSFMQINNF